MTNSTELMYFKFRYLGRGRQKTLKAYSCLTFILTNKIQSLLTNSTIHAEQMPNAHWPLHNMISVFFRTYKECPNNCKETTYEIEKQECNSIQFHNFSTNSLWTLSSLSKLLFSFSHTKYELLCWLYIPLTNSIIV